MSFKRDVYEMLDTRDLGEDIVGLTRNLVVTDGVGIK